jgi:hypothetical protein
MKVEMRFGEGSQFPHIGSVPSTPAGSTRVATPALSERAVPVTTSPCPDGASPCPWNA